MSAAALKKVDTKQLQLVMSSANDVKKDAELVLRDLADGRLDDPSALRRLWKSVVACCSKAAVATSALEPTLARHMTDAANAVKAADAAVEKVLPAADKAVEAVKDLVEQIVKPEAHLEPSTQESVALSVLPTETQPKQESPPPSTTSSEPSQLASSQVTQLPSVSAAPEVPAVPAAPQEPERQSSPEPSSTPTPESQAKTSPPTPQNHIDELSSCPDIQITLSEEPAPTVDES